MAELQGKVALVTGASRGIGRAIAVELMKRGARVVGTATTEEGAKSISDAGLVGKVLNVRDTAQTDALLAAMQKDVGDIVGREHTRLPGQSQDACARRVR